MLFAIDPLRRFPAALCVLGLAGCMSAPPAPPPPPPPPPAPAAPAPAVPAASAQDLAARRLLAAHDRLRALPPAELAREQMRLAEAGADPQNALELALALVLSPTHVPADTARALGLVDEVARNPSPEAAPWQPLARLLQSRLLEQRRLEETIERQNQQARETQRRFDQLGEKLEALKAIERNLVTRPSAPASAPAVRGASGALRARGS